MGRKGRSKKTQAVEPAEDSVGDWSIRKGDPFRVIAFLFSMLMIVTNTKSHTDGAPWTDVGITYLSAALLNSFFYWLFKSKSFITLAVVCLIAAPVCAVLSFCDVK